MPQECFGLREKGAIAPGYQADIVLMKDLEQFETEKVWIGGKLTAEDGRYLPETSYADIAPVRGSVIVKDFSKEKLKMHLKSDRVNVIEIQPGGVVTKKTVEEIKVDENGEFIRDPQKDLVKIAVVERHQGTGNVACGFLKGYGIKEGAVALSVAHDSHNIIAVGVSDEEITFAVESLIKQEGGIVLVKEGKIIEEMPMPIAGLMSDQSGEWVDEKLTSIHEKAYTELGICGDVEPVMTLCFMSLAVIPEIKLTEPEGTYLLWLDFKSLGMKEEQLKDLVENKAKLWLDSGAMFGPDGEGFERINIACPREILKQALTQLAESVHDR